MNSVNIHCMKFSKNKQKHDSEGKGGIYFRMHTEHLWALWLISNTIKRKERKKTKNTWSELTSKLCTAKQFLNIRSHIDQGCILKLCNFYTHWHTLSPSLPCHKGNIWELSFGFLEIYILHIVLHIA